MPIPLAPLIAGGASILGDGINALMQSATNRKNREFTEYMYNRSRADSLADWNMQNEYNSPDAQMKRLKLAGLNPNLVYGNGAANTSASVRSPEAPSGNAVAPRVNLGFAANSALAAYYDTSLKTAQADNLKAATTVATQDAMLKGAQTLESLSRNSRTQFDLKLDQQFASRLKEMSLQVAEAGLRNTEAQTSSTLSANERAIAMQPLSLEEKAVQISKMRAETATQPWIKKEIEARINNLIKDGKLKDYEIKLNQLGIQKNDPLIGRIIAQTLGTMGSKNTVEGRTGSIYTPFGALPFK